MDLIYVSIKKIEENLEITASKKHYLIDFPFTFDKKRSRGIMRSL